MVNGCSIEFNFNFFITLSFSFKVNSVFFSNASLYLSGKLSILSLGIVSLFILVIFYNLYDQLVLSPFENVFRKSVVLTKSPISYFGWILFRLSNKFL